MFLILLGLYLSIRNIENFELFNSERITMNNLEKMNKSLDKLISMFFRKRQNCIGEYQSLECDRECGFGLKKKVYQVYQQAGEKGLKCPKREGDLEIVDCINRFCKVGESCIDHRDCQSRKCDKGKCVSEHECGTGEFLKYCEEDDCKGLDDKQYKISNTRYKWNGYNCEFDTERNIKKKVESNGDRTIMFGKSSESPIVQKTIKKFEDMTKLKKDTNKDTTTTKISNLSSDKDIGCEETNLNSSCNFRAMCSKTCREYTDIKNNLINLTKEKCSYDGVYVMDKPIYNNEENKLLGSFSLEKENNDNLNVNIYKGKSCNSDKDCPPLSVCGREKSSSENKICYESSLICNNSSDYDDKCVCENGIPATGGACAQTYERISKTNPNPNVCMKCNNGYNIWGNPLVGEENKCRMNKCRCENGTPVNPGESCPNNGDELCASCNEGYYLENNKCIDQCTGLNDWWKGKSLDSRDDKKSCFFEYVNNYTKISNNGEGKKFGLDDLSIDCIKKIGGHCGLIELKNNKTMEDISSLHSEENPICEVDNSNGDIIFSKSSVECKKKFSNILSNLIGYYSLSNGCDSNCKSEIKNEENCPECYDEQGKISQNEYCNRKCITEDNNKPDGVCLNMCNGGNTDTLCSLVNGVERLISENSDDLYIKKIKKTVDAFKDNCSS